MTGLRSDHDRDRGAKEAARSGPDGTRRLLGGSRRQKDVAARLVYQLPLRARRHLMYLLFMRKRGHLRKPRTFNEKVNWRIIHDRRPLLIWACDKLQVKQEAARRGIKTATVFWSGTDLAELATVDLPDDWVLKPTHRSRRVHFGSGPVIPADIEALRRLTHGWLRDVQGAGKGEWGYSQAQHVFLVEGRLGGNDPLVDYRLYTYEGDVRFIQVIHDVNRTGRSAPVSRYYTSDWEPLEVRRLVKIGPVIPRPATFDEMLRIAKAVGSPFDFVRIDVYDVDGEVCLGEVTTYPGGGLIPFIPPDFDLELGEPWRLPELDRQGRSLT